MSFNSLLVFCFGDLVDLNRKMFHCNGWVRTRSGQLVVFLLYIRLLFLNVAIVLRCF